MLKLAWRGVRHNTGRYIATLVAITTGVAFFAATGFLGDRVVQSLEKDTRRQFDAVDVAVVTEDVPPDVDGLNVVDELRLPKSVVDQIIATEGVDGHALVLTGQVALRNQAGETVESAVTGRLWISNDDLNPIILVEGRGPTSSGEIAMDRGIASDQELEVGDETIVVTVTGPNPVTVVGITSFGESDSIDSGGTISIADADGFAWLAGGDEEYQELYLQGNGSQAALQERISPLLPAGFEAVAGDDFLAQKIKELGAIGRVLTRALQGFAVLALLVGGFVIYNTFNVLVAQRLKELAVLRAIGATPKQIKRALRFEGLVVGVLGSIAGLVIGLGFVYLIEFVMERFGASLPGSGVVIRTGTVRNGLLLGTIITVLSVMSPAHRAARTEPIEALRDAAVEVSPYTRGRLFFTATVTAVGVLCLVAGSHVALIAVGLLFLFVATIAAGPILAVLSARVTRPLMSRLGLEGRLASDNSARNPARTATTANALFIGVFLVTFVSVAGTSLKNYVVDQLKEVEAADFLLTSEGGSLDDELINAVEAIDGVAQVEPFRRESIAIDDRPSRVSTANLETLGDVAALKVDSGSLDDLRAGTIASSDEAMAMGDEVELVATDGQALKFEVVAKLGASSDILEIGSLVTVDDFDRLVGATAPAAAFIGAAQGSTTETRESLEALADDRPDLTLIEGNFLGRAIGGAFDFMINAVNGLLGMSVLVAVIGIINTLTLSIYERRRELGLLRVVGMLDKSVQRMVRLESMLIAILGTVVGVAFGLFAGWITISSVERLADTDVGLSLPVGLIALIILAGIAFGFLAALIPARRSTRLDVLDAIQAT